MTNKNYTDITVVLDRSGSMTTIKKDMEGGFTTFLEEQKKLPGDVRLSLMQFDTTYEEVYKGVPIENVGKLNLEPRGGTALYDAVGRTIVSIGARLSAMPEAERPGNVIVLIVTDGEENSSREFNAAQVKEMIERQSKEFSWVFSYLGSNQDAILAAQAMGISHLNSATYDSANAKSVWIAQAAGCARVRSTGIGQTFAYSELEKASLQEETK